MVRFATQTAANLGWTMTRVLIVAGSVLLIANCVGSPGKLPDIVGNSDRGFPTEGVDLTRWSSEAWT
jgi:hypothetical protein